MDGIKGKPGEVMTTTGDLVIACGLDGIRVSGVQPAGKSRMTAHEWAHGRGTVAGDTFGE